MVQVESTQRRQRPSLIWLTVVAGVLICAVAYRQKDKYQADMRPAIREFSLAESGLGNGDGKHFDLVVKRIADNLQYTENWIRLIRRLVPESASLEDEELAAWLKTHKGQLQFDSKDGVWRLP